MPLKDTGDMPDRDGVRFIIEEAMRSSLQKEEPSLFRRRTVKIFRYVVVEFKNP